MTSTFTIEGQKVVYNEDSKILKTTIEKPFMKASKILGWNEASPGLGINQIIVNLVIEHKCKLIVYVVSAEKDYWINWDHLEKFIKENNCDYKVSFNVWLKVIAWKQFVGYVHHLEAN